LSKSLLFNQIGGKNRDFFNTKITFYNFFLKKSDFIDFLADNISFYPIYQQEIVNLFEKKISILEKNWILIVF
jgi:hypothetical protein